MSAAQSQRRLREPTKRTGAVGGNPTAAHPRRRGIAAAALLLASLSATGAAAQGREDPADCTRLAGRVVGGASVEKAVETERGGFQAVAPAAGVVDPAFASLPAFCRVALSVRPSPESDIRIEVWLPSGGWNGRLVAVGNGGFQSRFDYAAMARALAKGYAVAGSNAGHDTSTGEFAIGHPERLKDWGYRDVHLMAVAAKAVVAAAYGKGPAYSYWNACSTGGRQGINAAERFPGDFDGLAIGAPANPMTRLQLGSIWNTLAVNRTADSFIPRETWQAIHQAVLAKCDAADGVADGLINDPMRCHFDPEVLACRGAASASCLTPGQLTALRAIYQGARNPQTGKQIYPGWAPSFEGGMPGPTAGRTPQQDAVDTFRIVFDDASWDYHSLDFDRDVARSDRVGNETMNAADPARLAPLFRRGGKILLYHGWNDVGISALGTLDYFNRAVAANGGDEAVRDSLRLFLAPGMNHCEGGDGPNQFDKLDVISDWVERGVAPDRIVASHFNSAGRVDRTRPLCPYPQIARYKGEGSTNDAASFACGTATPAGQRSADATSQGQRS